MTLAGSMTIEMYNSEIREVAHDLGYWIINQSYWYPDDKRNHGKSKAEEQRGKQRRILYRL